MCVAVLSSHTWTPLTVTHSHKHTHKNVLRLRSGTWGPRVLQAYSHRQHIYQRIFKERKFFSKRGKLKHPRKTKCVKEVEESERQYMWHTATFDRQVIFMSSMTVTTTRSQPINPCLTSVTEYFASKISLWANCCCTLLVAVVKPHSLWHQLTEGTATSNEVFMGLYTNSRI